MTVPVLVARARAAAADLGFEGSCDDDEGRLLHVLAGRRGIERVAEIGTGAGVGTAWLASALPPGVPLYSAEVDSCLARAAAELFADDPDVHVLEGDWRVALPPRTLRSISCSSTAAERRTTPTPCSQSPRRAPPS